MLKHYRGNKSKYNVTKDQNGNLSGSHLNGIYFATDKHEILMNGENYSGSTYADIEISGGS